MKLLALAVTSLLALAAGLGGTAHADTVVTDGAHGFTVHVPDGFTENADGKKMPQALYAWARTGDGQFEMLAIADLQGEIAEGDIDLDDFARGMASSSGARVVDSHQTHLVWKDSDLPVIVGHMSTSGVELGYAGVEVPLPGSAVMVMAVGTTNVSQLEARVRTMMATFDGENDWTSDRHRRIGWVASAVGIVLIGILFFARMESRRRRAGSL